MKICFIVYNFNNLGGIEKINNTIISELLKRRKDFHIDLISICGTSGKEFFPFDSDEININYLFNITNDHFTKESYDVSSKILSIGRIARQKGFDYAIEIGTEVFNKHPDWSWHIYGSGDEKYLLELRNKIKKLKLENNIFFHGLKIDMNSIYPQYSLFCLTSRLEGFGLVLLEALNHNLPLISFDYPCGPNEIISDNVNGYLIPCFDIKIYQDKLNYLIENPEVRSKFSRNCEKSRSAFDIDQIMDQWIQLFDSLA